MEISSKEILIITPIHVGVHTNAPVPHITLRFEGDRDPIFHLQVEYARQLVTVLNELMYQVEHGYVQTEEMVIGN